jgi:hypothetical protein
MGLRDLLDGVTGGGTQQWAGSVEDLLYEGESIRETVALGDGKVVVTTHRLLAFTPDSEGENFRDVDLPNVVGVESDADGDVDILVRGVKTLGVALVLVLVGQLIDFGSLIGTTSIDTGGAGGAGIGGLLGTLNGFLQLFARLDELLTLFGALLLLLAVVIFGAYLLTRQRVLRIDVAGDADDILVDAPDGGLDGTVSRLEGALFGAPSGDRDTRSQEGETEADGTDPLSSDGSSDAGFKSDDPL